MENVHVVGSSIYSILTNKSAHSTCSIIHHRPNSTYYGAKLSEYDYRVYNYPEIIS